MADRFCDYCGCDYVPDTEDECPECGFRVPLEKPCPFCGSDMYPSDGGFCPACGLQASAYPKQVTRAAYYASVQKESPKRSPDEAKQNESQEQADKAAFEHWKQKRFRRNVILLVGILIIACAYFIPKGLDSYHEYEQTQQNMTVYTHGYVALYDCINSLDTHVDQWIQATDETTKQEAVAAIAKDQENLLELQKKHKDIVPSKSQYAYNVTLKIGLDSYRDIFADVYQIVSDPYSGKAPKLLRQLDSKLWATNQYMKTGDKTLGYDFNFTGNLAGTVNKLKQYYGINK